MTDDSQNPGSPLTFESDHGSNRSRWVAGGLAVAIAAWMGSGLLLPSADPDEVEASDKAIRAVSVAVRPSVAQAVAQVFVAEGQALPARDTAIRAETSGRIGEVLVEMGADLEAEQVIARFDVAARQSDLDRATEERARAQREFENASSLLDRGVSTADRVAEARAALAAAEAGVTAAREAIADTEIRAPFAGRLELLEIETGEIVTTGEAVGRIVDNRPLKIQIQIPQQSLRDIEVGQQAEVSFITGDAAEGIVRFVATNADPETRTFLARIEVPNADGAIPAGISAKLRIPTGEQTAHFVSPAILSLDTDGTLGIKTVNAENVVEFHEIRIVRAQTDGIWVSGLPEETRIISIGQGFVNDGETVDPQEDPEGPARVPQEPASAIAPKDPAGSGEGRIIEPAGEVSGELDTPSARATRDVVR